MAPNGAAPRAQSRPQRQRRARAADKGKDAAVVPRRRPIQRPGARNREDRARKTGGAASRLRRPPALLPTRRGWRGAAPRPAVLLRRLVPPQRAREERNPRRRARPHLERAAAPAPTAETQRARRRHRHSRRGALSAAPEQRQRDKPRAKVDRARARLVAAAEGVSLGSRARSIISDIAAAGAPSLAVAGHRRRVLSRRVCAAQGFHSFSHFSAAVIATGGAASPSALVGCWMAAACAAAGSVAGP